ncbi:MAG: TIGR02757 family protein [Myxococcota bacterium]|nr:TIGR02757 family protein [Myxococcota bacterium]
MIEAVSKLSAYLEGLLQARDIEKDREADPVRFPWRFSDPCDRTLVALFAASLAYGRARAIGEALEHLLLRIGERPAQLAATEEIDAARARFQGFRYRFTDGEALARLWVGLGALLRRHQSLLEAARWADTGYRSGEDLVRTYGRLRLAIRAPTQALPHHRGFSHLLPDPALGSAVKRPALFFRWMVRGPDPVDFGLWSELNPARLWMPLDTHVHRISAYLGLTERKRADLTAAREIRDALSLVDPYDPLRFDLALAHLGISGT